MDAAKENSYVPKTEQGTSQELEDLLNNISRCMRVEKLNGTMQALTHQMGYASFIYADLNRRLVGKALKPTFYYLGTVRTDFIENYQNENYVNHDPTVTRAASTNVPFTWADCVEFQESGSRRGPKTRALKIFKVAQDFGYRQGYVIPAHAVDAWGNPSHAMVCLYSQDDSKRISIPDARSRWLRLAVLLCHERIIELRGATSGEPPRVTSLTDRERDCLAWACRGKTGGETADILGIGERTVEFHLQNAMGKLGVNNKVHAIAVAISRGLLVP